MAESDYGLIDAALRLIREAGAEENHTVAAAVRTTDGEIITGLNLAHFTGGPCAEVVALANVATARAGAHAIVAVSGNTILAPCGRCRQIMIDYWPAVNVVVPDVNGSPLTVTIIDLLPFACFANA